MESSMAFSKEYQERKTEVENYISTLLREIHDYPEPLYSAVSYSLSEGGKRIRPILFLETYRIFGGQLCESVIKISNAVECIHTYSLIHDDLPCMDNDDMRRGKPTNHKVYGEANAVLAGDALLNLAYQLMFEATALFEDKNRAVQACTLLARAAGGNGLIGGQTLDLLAEDEKVTANRLQYIYQHKTGDLISAAIMAGAILAGATSEELAHLKGFGDYFGMSFQIRDDILDAEEKGDGDKNTFVHIYGLANARSTLVDCVDKAIHSLSQLHKDVEFMRKFALKSAERKE